MKTFKFRICWDGSYSPIEPSSYSNSDARMTPYEIRVESNSCKRAMEFATTYITNKTAATPRKFTLIPKNE